MTVINCHIPIKLRVVGEPSDAQLAQLGQNLVRVLQQRIALAERTIASRYNLASLHGETELREAYDPAREAAQSSQYQLPSYDRHGQPTSVALQTHGRAWIIRKAINFRAYVGQFLTLMESWSTLSQDPALYFDLYQEQRWMSLWLVQVNQSMLRSQLMRELAGRVHALNRAPKQTEYYAISGDESFRQQLIELDQDQLVAREMPSLKRRAGTLEPGGDLRLPAGSQVLFVSMALPIIELPDRAEAGARVAVTVQLRDLTFIVNPVGFDRFERRFGLPWADYLREFGDTPAVVQIQPLTVRKRMHIIALTALVEQTVGRQLAAGSAPETVVYSRLDVLSDGTLAAWPPVARALGNQWSDETTRRLLQAQLASELEPGWRTAYVSVGLAISPKSIELARYRPLAGQQADLIIPLIRDRLVTVAERWAFIDFVKHHYSQLFPVPFEVLLDQLKRREQGKWFDRLFAAAKEAKDYDLRLLIISMAEQTRYANDPQVRALVSYHNQVSRDRSTGNVYKVAEQQLILNKLFGDKTVSVNAVLHDVHTTYVHEEKRYKPKPQYAAIWEAALLREALELIGRIDRGEDSQALGNGYSDTEFAEAVLKAVFSRLHITDDTYGSYFDTVTIQLSVRFLGLKLYTDELGIETITVLYQVVERANGGSWTNIGEILEARDADFDYMIDRWVHEHVSSAIITIAHIAVAIAAIGVAWEFGVIQALTRLAGGAKVVIPSVVLSAIYESVIHGFTFENLVIGAINGYLGALFFRGANVLARGLFGSSITTITFRNGLLRWIGVQIFKGSVGGGATGAALVFTHDVYLIATGRGSWSSPANYTKSISWGAALGVGMEFAGPLVVEPVLQRLVGGAIDVAKVLYANGISPARWQVWSMQVLANMRRSLNAVLESDPLRATTLRDGFRLLYEQIGEGFAALGGALRGRVQLAVFRQLIEFSGEAFSGAAAKGLEKFLAAVAGQLDEDAALALVKRILAPGGGAQSFFEALNLFDQQAVSQLISRGELAGWLLVFERNVELTPAILAGLERLYGSALGAKASGALLQQVPKDTLPQLLELLGGLERASVNDLAREGYLLLLARSPRVLQFIRQPENLAALRSSVAAARGKLPLATILSTLEHMLEQNPGLTARDIEAGALRARLPVVSAGPFHSASWPGSSRSQARFTISDNGATVEVLNLNRGDLPAGSGGAMLASALRAAGASKPTKIWLMDVVNTPTLEALKKGQPFADTVLGKTFAATAEELGGRITSAKPISYMEGVGRGNRTRRYDVMLTLEY